MKLYSSLLISHYYLLFYIQNENDPTILSGWRRVVPVEEFFDIISEVHCNEKGHIGSKKTVTEVRLVPKFDVHVWSMYSL